MSERKVRAWAVVDKDGDIVTAPSRYSMDMLICKSAERCEEWKVNRPDERVVPVEIVYKDPGK